MVAGKDQLPKEISVVFEILNDGKWHVIDEIREKMKLSESQVGKVTDFLCEYGFVLVDRSEKKIKVNEIVREFLSKATTS